MFLDFFISDTDNNILGWLELQACQSKVIIYPPCLPHWPVCACFATSYTCISDRLHWGMWWAGGTCGGFQTLPSRTVRLPSSSPTWLHIRLWHLRHPHWDYDGPLLWYGIGHCPCFLQVVIGKHRNAYRIISCSCAHLLGVRVLHLFNVAFIIYNFNGNWLVL